MAKRKVTKKANDQFKKNLRNAVVEKDVENAYKEVLNSYYNDEYVEVSSPYNTDGYYTDYWMLRLLLEAKYKQNFLQRNAQCKTITQAIWYLKKFEQEGEKLPNVILIGDEDECFIVYGSHLYKYLECDVDWTIAPSEAASKNNDFVVKLMDDKNICPFVFKINTEKFTMQDVCLAIDELGQRGELHQIKLDAHNIRRIYDDFLRTVIGDRIAQYTTNDLVSIFILAMVDPINCYLHPQKKNMLVVPNKLKEVQVNGASFNAFFSQFNRNYTQKECDVFTSMADVLIEETKRKMDGSFWTPSIWADRAISMLTETLGDNWRDEYVVWDACCGSMNLTRDYEFKNLFASTLHDGELSISAPYNTNATKFSYDFLNDDIGISPEADPASIKMPLDLFNALKANKKIVFYMNPPYATANEAGAKGTSKKGTAASKINKCMVSDNMGKASQQLFAQFFYRIIQLKESFSLTNVVVAFFVKPIYMIGNEYWASFLERFKSHFYFEKGNLFKASDFSNVKDSWGITFSIYTSKADDRNSWGLSVEHCKYDAIEVVGNKTMMQIPSEERTMSYWIRQPLLENKGKYPKVEKGTFPQFSSAFNVNSGINSGSLVNGSLGYLVNVANNIYKSYRDVFLLTGTASMGHGVNVVKDNFERVCVNLASRKITDKSWINDKDEFLVPDIGNSKYKEFELDCIVYSLFNLQASYQTSLRNITHNGKIYPIYNQWFFMSKKEMEFLAEEYNFTAMQADLRIAEDRFVYKYLEASSLSKEAADLLNEARHVIRISFPYRSQFYYENEKYQLQAWDAGWYQIYKLIKEYPVETEFEKYFNALSEKIKPCIYELGILPD